MKNLFDVLNDGYVFYWIPIVGFIFMITGLYIIYINRKIKQIVILGAGLVFSIGGLLFGGSYTFVTWNEYQFITTKMINNEIKIEEGIIENFKHENEDGTTSPEEFTVNKTRFSFISTSLTSAYNIPVGKGGKAKAGAYAKITYIPSIPSVDDKRKFTFNKIVKLEIKE